MDNKNDRNDRPETGGENLRPQASGLVNGKDSVKWMNDRD